MQCLYAKWSVSHRLYGEHGGGLGGVRLGLRDAPTWMPAAYSPSPNFILHDPRKPAVLCSHVHEANEVANTR